MRECGLAPWPGRAVGPIQSWFDPPKKRTPLAPAATGNDALLVLNDKVSLIVDQLGVDAKYMASDRVSLLRRIVADAQGGTGESNEFAKRGDVRSLGSTKFHYENLEQAA